MVPGLLQSTNSSVSFYNHANYPTRLRHEVEEGVEAAWVAEIERRAAELDAGAAQAIPWEDVKARLLQGMDAPKKR